MSCDYYLVCHECNEAIHVGQDGLSGSTFYSGEPGCMKALKEFLWNHERHKLSFEPEQFAEDVPTIAWPQSP